MSNRDVIIYPWIVKEVEKLSAFSALLMPVLDDEDKEWAIQVLTSYLQWGGLIKKGTIPAIIYEAGWPVYSQKYLSELYGITPPTIRTGKKALAEIVHITHKSHTDPAQFERKEPNKEQLDWIRKRDWKRKKKAAYEEWDQGQHCKTCGRIPENCECQQIYEFFESTADQNRDIDHRKKWLKMRKLEEKMSEGETT